MRGRRGLLTAAVMSVGLSVAGCSSTTPLEEAFATCDEAGRIADEGHTLIVDTKGDDDATGDSFVDLACLLTELDAPSSVTAHMDSTRALDGMQTTNWDKFDARWTYHPDRGMGLTITLAD